MCVLPVRPGPGPACGHQDNQKKKLHAARIFRKLDATPRIFEPRRSVVLASDGPGPLAKVFTQRKRRLKASRQSKHKMSGLNITPGTEFMFTVRRACEYSRGWLLPVQGHDILHHALAPTATPARTRTPTRTRTRTRTRTPTHIHMVLYHDRKTCDSNAWGCDSRVHVSSYNSRVHVRSYKSCYQVMRAARYSTRYGPYSPGGAVTRYSDHRISRL